MKISDSFEIASGKIARNRVVLPPMVTGMAIDGFPNDFHIQHYGARAYGGVGTIIIEATAVSPEGRITEDDLGIWSDMHAQKFIPIIRVCRRAGSLIGIQINHAGSKSTIRGHKLGATKKLPNINYENISLLSSADFKTIFQKFIDAAVRAKNIGFDFVEIHAAHGYLLCQLLSPDLNQVVEGDILKRGKLLIDIIKGIKQKTSIKVGIRISGSEYTSTGLTPKEYAPLFKELAPYLDYVHVSSGGGLGKVPDKSVDGKLKFLSLAVEVKKMVSVPVITVGNYTSKKDIELAISQGIDAVAVGRMNILNPACTITDFLDIEELDEKIYHWNHVPFFTSFKSFRKRVENE